MHFLQARLHTLNTTSMTHAHHCSTAEGKIQVSRDATSLDLGAGTIAIARVARVWRAMELEAACAGGNKGNGLGAEWVACVV